MSKWSFGLTKHKAASESCSSNLTLFWSISWAPPSVGIQLLWTAVGYTGHEIVHRMWARASVACSAHLWLRQGGEGGSIGNLLSFAGWSKQHFSNARQLLGRGRKTAPVVLSSWRPHLLWFCFYWLLSKHFWMIQAQQWMTGRNLGYIPSTRGTWSRVPSYLEFQHVSTPRDRPQRMVQFSLSLQGGRSKDKELWMSQKKAEQKDWSAQVFSYKNWMEISPSDPIAHTSRKTAQCCVLSAKMMSQLNAV